MGRIGLIWPVSRNTATIGRRGGTMRHIAALAAFVLSCSVFTSAQTLSIAQRNKAIEGVNACL